MCDHFFPFLILVRHGVLCLRSLLACFHHHFCLHINGHPRDQEQDLSGDQKAHGCPHGQEVRQRTGRQSATGERWVVTVLEKVARGPPLTHIVMALACILPWRTKDWARELHISIFPVRFPILHFQLFVAQFVNIYDQSFGAMFRLEPLFIGLFMYLPNASQSNSKTYCYCYYYQ